MKGRDCIVSVAIREPYTTLQRRQIKSMAPFLNDFDVLTWTDNYPPGAKPYNEVLYGFKVHAIQAAKDAGYKNILWLDSACYAVSNPKVFFDIIEEQGYYFTGGGPKLSENCSDLYLDVNFIRREDVKDVELLSGSIYGFNMHHPVGGMLFDRLKTDEGCGFFMHAYTDDSARIDCKKIITRPPKSRNVPCETVPSHRHDEASLSYLAWQYGCNLDIGEKCTGYFQGSVIKADKNTGHRVLVTVDEHTFDPTLLHKTSRVLDAGCRGFGFSKWIAENIQCYIAAFDADSDIKAPDIPNMEYVHGAITAGKEDTVTYYAFGNGTGSYTSAVGPAPAVCQEKTVMAYQIPGNYYDLIKLDIEGGEYDILMGMKYPLATQISVEFHEHTLARKGEDYMQRLFDHLRQWYDIIGDKLESRHGCGENYWDVLFVLKGK